MRLLLVSLLLPVWSQGNTVQQAREHYQKTEYNQALQLLGKRNDPESLALAGKAKFQLGEYREAIDLLEQALQKDPRNSHYQLWLGKALGRRAETSSFITAPKYAVECRKAFEKAVELDAKNVEAWSDLFQYFLNAPGFLGGGMDKAEDAARRIGELSAAEGHWALAQIAEKKKDYASTEQEFRRALDLEPKQPGRLLDLARFHSRRGRHAESDKLFEQAAQLAPSAPNVLYARAQSLIESSRDLSTARRLLERYLTMPLTPDDPARRDAEKLLKKTPTR